ATGRNQGLKFVEKLSRASYPHRSGAGPQAVGRARPFGIARSRAQTRPGWPSEPVWDRSVQSANKTWLAERVRLGSLGPERKQNLVGRASPFGIARPERKRLEQRRDDGVELVHGLLPGDLLAVDIEGRRALEAEIVDRLVAHALNGVEEVLVLQRLVEAVVGESELQRDGLDRIERLVRDAPGVLRAEVGRDHVLISCDRRLRVAARIGRIGARGSCGR